MLLARHVALIALILSGMAWISTARAQSATIGATLDWWKLDDDMLTFICLPEHAPGWCADAEEGIRPPPPPASTQDRRRRLRAWMTKPGRASLQS